MKCSIVLIVSLLGSVSSFAGTDICAVGGSPSFFQTVCTDNSDNTVSTDKDGKLDIMALGVSFSKRLIDKGYRPYGDGTKFVRVNVAAPKAQTKTSIQLGH